MFTRTIHPEIRVADASKGLVDYIASDETLDSYREIIRANGWRFNYFKKNAPFVDSHDYYTIAKQLGKVVEFSVDGKHLIERVQWAIDVPENQLAMLGWKMTEAGYLKAVSVGFRPTKYASKWDSDRSAWLQQLQELGIHEEQGIRTVYIEQEQLELSACVLGANPNALAKAYKASVLNDTDLDLLASLQASWEAYLANATISGENGQRQPAGAPAKAAHDAPARERQRQLFLSKIQLLIKQQ